MTQPSTQSAGQPAAPLVGVIMGSKSDWSTMSHTADMLVQLGIPHEVKVVSAHRTPDLLFAYADEAAGRGIEVIIAGAGGAKVVAKELISAANADAVDKKWLEFALDDSGDDAEKIEAANRTANGDEEALE